MKTNQELKNEVALLIDEVETTHRYSMSRIYAAYNEVFNLNESPQACASCLIRKVRQLKHWLDQQQDQQADQTADPASATGNKPRRARKSGNSK